MKNIEIPLICDYDCPHADFAPAETAGICRTMSAIWCKKLKELVNKNAPCELRRRESAAKQKPAKASRGAASKSKSANRRRK